jgi:hypothetical protein
MRVVYGIGYWVEAGENPGMRVKWDRILGWVFG